MSNANANNWITDFNPPLKIDDTIGADILQEIYDFIGEYVIYPNEYSRVAHTLWIAHTYFMDRWESTPRLHFKSPEWGSGKTRALEVSEHIVKRGFIALNMSSAYLIRKLGEDVTKRPTLLYDEIDTVFGPKAKDHEDIRGVINAGHRRSGKSGRCLTAGSVVKTVDFPAYGAVAMAGLGDLPDTISSRAVVVSMKRRAGRETVKPWRARTCEPLAQELAKKLAEWSDSIKGQHLEHWPHMPPGVSDRDADVWESLICVADFAGEKWPVTSRVSAVSAVSDKREMGEDDSQGVALLSDIYAIGRRITKSWPVATDSSNSEKAISTANLLHELNQIKESPWRTIRRDGGAMDPRGLAVRLKPYGIKSTQIRWDDHKTLKGFWWKDFEDSINRYVKNIPILDDDEDDEDPFNE